MFPSGATWETVDQVSTQRRCRSSDEALSSDGWRSEVGARFLKHLTDDLILLNVLTGSLSGRKIEQCKDHIQTPSQDQSSSCSTRACQWVKCLHTGEEAPEGDVKGAMCKMSSLVVKYWRFGVNRLSYKLDL